MHWTGRPPGDRAAVRFNAVGVDVPDDPEVLERLPIRGYVPCAIADMGCRGRQPLQLSLLFLHPLPDTCPISQPPLGNAKKPSPLGKGDRSVVVFCGTVAKRATRPRWMRFIPQPLLHHNRLKALQPHHRYREAAQRAASLRSPSPEGEALGHPYRLQDPQNAHRVLTFKNQQFVADF